jgi:O-antigen ligase
MTVLLQSDRTQGAGSTIALFGLSGFILLLPFGRLSELGVLLCLISSAIFLFAARKRHARLSFLPSLAPALSAALACWALIFAAALISCLDSTERLGSLQTTFASVRFAALIIAAAQLTSAQRVFVGKLVGITLGIWCLDALLQAASGLSLGGKSNADRISGIFGDDNLKLGLVIATLAPVALYAATKFDRAWLRDKRTWVYLVIVWFVIAAAVLLGGARAGWVMFAIASALWGLRITRYQWRKTGLGLLIACTAALGLATLLNASNSQFAQRVERTMAIFDVKTADFALAGRLPIWQTAARMALAHPVNGVGVRAFRYAYPEFAQPTDPWVRPASRENAANMRAVGASHPHQLLLEILTETGLVGLVLWGFATFALVRAWRQARSANRAQAWPYGCALLVLLFPINTHTAMYSSFWAGVLWWLVAMLSAELDGAEEAAV